MTALQIIGFFSLTFFGGVAYGIRLRLSKQSAYAELQSQNGLDSFWGGIVFARILVGGMAYMLALLTWGAFPTFFIPGVAATAGVLASRAFLLLEIETAILAERGALLFGIAVATLVAVMLRNELGSAALATAN